MNPGLARFTQPDTIIPSLANPQTLNRYSYVNNNPIRYTDPTGHIALDSGDCADDETYDLDEGCVPSGDKIERGDDNYCLLHPDTFDCKIEKDRESGNTPGGYRGAPAYVRPPCVDKNMVFSKNPNCRPVAEEFEGDQHFAGLYCVSYRGDCVDRIGVEYQVTGTFTYTFDGTTVSYVESYQLMGKIYRGGSSTLTVSTVHGNLEYESVYMRSEYPQSRPNSEFVGKINGAVTDISFKFQFIHKANQSFIYSPINGIIE